MTAAEVVSVLIKEATDRGLISAYYGGVAGYLPLCSHSGGEFQ